jgi:hypothetical protein
LKKEKLFELNFTDSDISLNDCITKPEILKIMKQLIKKIINSFLLIVIERNFISYLGNLMNSKSY